MKWETFIVYSNTVFYWEIIDPSRPRTLLLRNGTPQWQCWPPKSCGVARWSPKGSDLFQLPTDDDLIVNLTFLALCHIPKANPTYFLQWRAWYCSSGSPLPSRRDVATIGFHSSMRVAVQSEEHMPSTSTTSWVQQHHLDKPLTEPAMIRNIFANNYFGQWCVVACRSVAYFLCS